MIKNFVDRDGKKYNFRLRGSYTYIRSARKLKDVLDRSTSVAGLKQIHPTWPAGSAEKLAAAYAGKTYHEIMQIFGMVTHSERIQESQK